MRHHLGIHNKILVYEASNGNNMRMIVPKPLQEETLKTLHRGHRGILRMHMRAKDTVYWSGICPDIESKRRCITCEKFEPRKPRTPAIERDIGKSPFFK